MTIFLLQKLLLAVKKSRAPSCICPHQLCNLVDALFQARPLFKDRRKFPLMADPALEGQYPLRGLYQALAVAAMCVQEQPSMRPLIGDVVTALTYLASQTYDPEAHGISRMVAPGTPPRTRTRSRSHGSVDQRGSG
jgi:hypothetical protein